MDIDTDVIGVKELTDTYDVNLYDTRVTGMMKEFELVNPLNNHSYTGRLYWNENDGYDIYWTTSAPLLAKRDFFESALDAALVPYNTAGDSDEG
jgi:hypothetical protein